MKIYDISKPIFQAEVYPSDPPPTKEVLASISAFNNYNLTTFKMTPHTGTHIDAPSHFIKEGMTVDQISLDRFVGLAYVIDIGSEINNENLELHLTQMSNINISKILFKGPSVLTVEAARLLIDSNVSLIGTENLSFGTNHSETLIHQLLLGAETALLESLDLSAVKSGIYFLNAAPIKLDGLEAAPCRALLIESDIFFNNNK